MQLTARGRGGRIKGHGRLGRTSVRAGHRNAIPIGASWHVMVVGRARWQRGRRPPLTTESHLRQVGRRDSLSTSTRIMMCSIGPALSLWRGALTGSGVAGSSSAG